MPKESVEDAQTEIAYSQRATRKRGKRKSMISENYAVQNTIEILSHHLPYAARSDKATEIRALYGARDTKATEEKSSMKPKRCTATENKKGLKAVYKRIEAEETGKYEARSEEAAEMISQQQCILSGEVYLRHRLEKPALKKICLPCFSYTDTIPHQLPACNLRRSGVQACKKLSLFPPSKEYI